jgi:hypothetical protein
MTLLLALVGSSVATLELARLTAFGDDQGMTVSVVPTPGVSQPAPIKAGVPWSVTDTLGRSWCVSDHPGETFAPITQAAR